VDRGHRRRPMARRIYLHCRIATPILARTSARSRCYEALHQRRPVSDRAHGAIIRGWSGAARGAAASSSGLGGPRSGGDRETGAVRAPQIGWSRAMRR
jgi:hypothetical protein